MAQNSSYRSVNVTRFFMKFVGFWNAETPRERKLLNALLIYAVCAIVWGLLVMVADLYHCLGNFLAVTNNLCTTLILIMILVKMGNFIVNRELVSRVIIFAETNFWHKNYDEVGMEIIKEYNDRGVIMTYAFSVLVQLAAFEYITAPLIERITTNTTERILPFALYVNIPYTVTPYYEIIYLIQSLSTFHSGICTFCFDNFICTFNIHVAAQLKILAYKVELIAEKYFESVEGEKALTEVEATRRAFIEMKNCINQHRALITFVEDMESLFTLIVLGQMLLSSMVICFGGFQFLAASSAVRKCIFLIHFVGGLAQLLIYTWTCNDIIVQSLGIAEAAYKSRWYLLPESAIGKAVKNGLMLIMVRARRPCALTAGGFAIMSLDTFTTILSTSLSYFTLLRQMNEN